MTNCQDCRDASARGRELLRTLGESGDYRTLCDSHRNELSARVSAAKYGFPRKSDNDYSGTWSAKLD